MVLENTDTIIIVGNCIYGGINKQTCIYSTYGPAALALQFAGSTEKRPTSTMYALKDQPHTWNGLWNYYVCEC